MNTISHPRDAGANQRELPARDLDSRPVFCNDQTTQVSSAEQGREGCDPGNLRSSRAFHCDFADLVHELANTTTAVLMNAQVLGWRLPPYSRLKRPLRELERNAQRGGELMNRLLSRLATEATEQADSKLELKRPLYPLATETDGRDAAPAKLASKRRITVTAQGPDVDSGKTVNLPPRMDTRPAPVFSSRAEVELTSGCDACTSTFPKKG